MMAVELTGARGGRAWATLKRRKKAIPGPGKTPKSKVDWELSILHNLELG